MHPFQYFQFSNANDFIKFHCHQCHYLFLSQCLKLMQTLENKNAKSLIMHQCLVIGINRSITATIMYTIQKAMDNTIFLHLYNIKRNNNILMLFVTYIIVSSIINNTSNNYITGSSDTAVNI